MSAPQKAQSAKFSPLYMISKGFSMVKSEKIAKSCGKIC
jgi:hypothetical protein